MSNTRKLDPALETGLKPFLAPLDHQGILQEEMDKLAVQLHDGILQHFGTCVLKAQLCERLLQKEQYTLAEKELGLLEESLNSAIDSVRDLVARLRQPASR